MRGLSRRKSALSRKRALRALPEDDGLVPVLITKRGFLGKTQHWELQTPEQVEKYCTGKMATHDKRKPLERWGGNQWGEQWVCDLWTRELFARDQPLLKTDLTYRAWRRACGLSRR